MWDLADNVTLTNVDLPQDSIDHLPADFDDPSASATIAEGKPEPVAAEANADKLTELAARIDDLPDTPEANQLREAFDEFAEQFEPDADDATRYLADLERLVDEQNHDSDGAPPDTRIWAETEALKALKGDQLEQFEANKINGSDAEQAVIMSLMAGEVIPELDSTATLRGTQVEVTVPPTNEKRIIDVVVQLPPTPLHPEGEVVALEVKYGNADRNERQERLDNAMAIHGCQVMDSDEEAFPTGPHPAIRTVVVRR